MPKIFILLLLFSAFLSGNSTKTHHDLEMNSSSNQKAFLKTEGLKNFTKNLPFVDRARLAHFTTSNELDYKIKVDLQKQRVTVSTNNTPIRVMPCSTGKATSPTPPGTFKTHQHVPSVTFEIDEEPISYHFITKFNSDIAFHSKIFGNHPFVEEGDRKFSRGEVSSMGCVRLLKADAKWLYENINLSTVVEVF